MNDITHDQGEQVDTIGRLKSFGVDEPWQSALLLPRRWDDFSALTDSLYEIEPDSRGALVARIASQPTFEFQKGPPRAQFMIEDGRGVRASVTLFGDTGQARDLTVGKRYLMKGKTDTYNGQLQFRLDEIVPTAWAGRARPVYPGKSGVIGPDLVRTRQLALLPKHMEDAASQVIARLSPLGDEDQLLALAKADTQFNSIESLLWSAHLPESISVGEQAHEALERLAAADMLLRAREEAGTQTARDPLLLSTASLEARTAALPYPLTDEQSKAVAEITEDLRRPVAMRRLLSGDVGTGKTAVYGTAVATAVDAGARCVVMLPNINLATQVFREMAEYWPDLDIKLVSGDTKKRENLRDTQVLVGTTALLNRAIGERDLVVADEQHKFSKAQREKMAAGGGHLLEVSATSIPRSQALLQFGVMDLSMLTKGHVDKTLHTRLRYQEDRAELFQDAIRSIEAGHQLAVVYPLKENQPSGDDAAPVSEADERKSAITMYETWEKRFPGRVRLLHGQMSDQEKQDVIADMKADKADILISTTVIEVGLTLPRLRRLMVISADRHGLTGLHQLRGRLARHGGEGFFDLYIPQPKDQINPAIIERLSILEQTTDGFAVAEHDMVQRGYGELTGEKQSGKGDGLLLGRTLEVARLTEMTAALPDLQSVKPEPVPMDTVVTQPEALVVELEEDNTASQSQRPDISRAEYEAALALFDQAYAKRYIERTPEDVHALKQVVAVRKGDMTVDGASMAEQDVSGSRVRLPDASSVLNEVRVMLENPDLKGRNLTTIARVLQVTKKKAGESVAQQKERLSQTLNGLMEINNQRDAINNGEFKVAHLRDMARQAAIKISSRDGKRGLQNKLIDKLLSTQATWDTAQSKGEVLNAIRALRRENKPVPLMTLEALGAGNLSGQGVYTPGDYDVAKMLGHTSLMPEGERESESIYHDAAAFIDDPMGFLLDRQEGRHAAIADFTLTILRFKDAGFAVSSIELRSAFEVLELGVPASDYNVMDLADEISATQEYQSLAIRLDQERAAFVKNLTPEESLWRSGLLKHFKFLTEKAERNDDFEYSITFKDELKLPEGISRVVPFVHSATMNTIMREVLEYNGMTITDAVEQAETSDDPVLVKLRQGPTYSVDSITFDGVFARDSESDMAMTEAVEAEPATALSEEHDMTTEPKHAWELTREAWVQQAIARDIYAYPYMNDDSLRGGYIEGLERDWYNLLLEHSQHGRISNVALDDIVAREGYNGLREFIGVHEPGVEGYLMPDHRLWEKTYSQMRTLHDRGELGPTISNLRGFHRMAIENAMGRGEVIPEVVLKDYPEFGVTAHTQDVEPAAIAVVAHRADLALRSGEQVKLPSGAISTDVPKLDFSNERRAHASKMRMHAWLVENAVADASARGDEANLKVFVHTLDARSLSATDIDRLHLYLFDTPAPAQIQVAEDMEAPASTTDRSSAPVAVPASQNAHNAEPVKWFGSSEKASAWVAKQRDPHALEIVPGGNSRYEIFERSAAGDHVAAPAPQVAPRVVAEPVETAPSERPAPVVERAPQVAADVTPTPQDAQDATGDAPDAGAIPSEADAFVDHLMAVETPSKPLTAAEYKANLMRDQGAVADTEADTDAIVEEDDPLAPTGAGHEPVQPGLW
jgi:ATP-dependent DNA helicase RecG